MNKVMHTVIIQKVETIKIVVANPDPNVSKSFAAMGIGIIINKDSQFDIQCFESTKEEIQCMEQSEAYRQKEKEKILAKLTKEEREVLGYQ